MLFGPPSGDGKSNLVVVLRCEIGAPTLLRNGCEACIGCCGVVGADDAGGIYLYAVSEHLHQLKGLKFTKDL